MADLLVPDSDTIQETETDKQIRPGDVIYVERMNGIYRHYGIYVGKGTIIHYGTKDKDFGKGISIHKSTMKEFLKGENKYYICKFPEHANIENYHLFTKKEAVQRAYKRLGEQSYSLVTNNCEHFALWCRTNISQSSQIKKIEKALLCLKRKYDRRRN